MHLYLKMNSTYMNKKIILNRLFTMCITVFFLILTASKATGEKVGTR